MFTTAEDKRGFENILEDAEKGRLSYYIMLMSETKS
jgi:hypothetical protein